MLDTQLVLWIAVRPDLLPPDAHDLITDSGNDVVFSVVNLWEIAIKWALARSDFQFDPRAIRQRFRDENYLELPILAHHALAVVDLPPIHRYPFDRILIAQARAEGMTLLTTDARIAAYPGDVRRV